MADIFSVKGTPSAVIVSRRARRLESGRDGAGDRAARAPRPPAGPEHRVRGGLGGVATSGGPDDREAALRAFVARVAPDRAETGHLDRATSEVLRRFEAAGIDALLLKGPALAALLYTAGEHRSYSDIDLLVAPSRLEAAEKALGELGYTNADSETGVDDVGGVVHAHTWVRRAHADPTMIDLHHWLSGATARPAVAWQALSASDVDRGGRSRTAVLDPAGQAMHLALHAAQHGAAYGRQLDELGRALERLPAAAWDSAAALAEEIGATRAFAAGLRLLSQGAAEAARLRPAANRRGGLGDQEPSGTAARHLPRKSAGTGDHRVRAAGDPAPGAVSRPGVDRAPASGGRSQHARLIGAYAAHLARAPAWATRAWLFSRRARRAGVVPVNRLRARPRAGRADADSLTVSAYAQVFVRAAGGRVGPAAVRLQRRLRAACRRVRRAAVDLATCSTPAGRPTSALAVAAREAVRVGRAGRAGRAACSGCSSRRSARSRSRTAWRR